MSMTETAPRVDTRAQIRARLYNPPNGRESSELDIISPIAHRNNVFQLKVRIAAELAARQRAEQLALFDAFIEAHRRTGFCYGETTRRRVGLEQITRAVCIHFGQLRLHVLGERKTAALVRPRQIIMYLGRELTPLSLPQIGMHCGGRDHTTVLHAARKIAAGLSAGDDRLATEVADIRKALGVEA